MSQDQVLKEAVDSINEDQRLLADAFMSMDDIETVYHVNETDYERENSGTVFDTMMNNYGMTKRLEYHHLDPDIVEFCMTNLGLDPYKQWSSIHKDFSGNYALETANGDETYVLSGKELEMFEQSEVVENVDF